jgi:hypothetical protein
MAIPEPPAISTPPPSSPDSAPLKIRHGRRLLSEISDTRRDVVATKADTEAIIELLSPSEDENPVLTVLGEILATQQLMILRLEQIEKKINGLGKHLDKSKL